MFDSVAYADADGVQIAYRQTEPSGGQDVVVVSGAFFPMEALLEDRIARRFIDGLAQIGRLVIFDKRGVGLSDPVVDWSVPTYMQWADDLAAVVATAELDHPSVVSWDTFGIGRAFAARWPDVVGQLVLINPVPSVTAFAERVAASGTGQGFPSQIIERLAFPSRIDDPGFQAWLEQAGRAGASPTVAGRLWDATLAIRGGLTPPEIQCRTLVVHRSECMADRPMVREVADAIPGAEFVQVDGSDIFPIAGDVDAILAEISRFVTGSAILPSPDRSVRAVLFTDLVASTGQAVDSGDEAWRSVLDRHDAAVRACVERAGGDVVKFTGDGVLALLPSAAAGIAVARSIRAELDAQGLGIRAGVHVGDVDRRGDDVSGVAINVAARVMDQARAGETLVSESVVLSTLGTDVTFGDPRMASLKGLPDQWRLYPVTGTD